MMKSNSYLVKTAAAIGFLLAGSSVTKAEDPAGIPTFDSSKEPAASYAKFDVSCDKNAANPQVGKEWHLAEFDLVFPNRCNVKNIKFFMDEAVTKVHFLFKTLDGNSNGQEYVRAPEVVRTDNGFQIRYQPVFQVYPEYRKTPQGTQLVPK